MSKLTGKKGRCPDCKAAIVGLYQNIFQQDPKKRWKRRAYYCKKCDRVLSDDEVVYKKIVYEKM